MQGPNQIQNLEEKLFVSYCSLCLHGNWVSVYGCAIENSVKMY